MSRSLNRPNADKPTTPELPAPVDPTPIPASRPSALPPGVAMHDAGVSPYATREPAGPPDPVDPKGPPPGWKGSYHRCGGCGDFLGNAPACPKCSPSTAIENVQMSNVPKVMA